MKKILCICLVACLTSFSVAAQTEKQTWLAGGSLGLQSTSGSTVFVANPNFGVFVKDRLAIGGEFYLATANSFTNWSIGPYARLYFAGTPTGSFFGQAGVAIGGATNSDASLRGIGKLGYAIFLNKHVALEFAASYNAGKGTDVFILGVGFQIHLKK